jgi:hypothetical protein
MCAPGGAARGRGQSHRPGRLRHLLDTAAFRGKDGKVLTEVAIRIPGRALKFVEKDGAWKSTVSVDILILDDQGKDVLRRGEKVNFIEHEPQDPGNPITFQTIIKQLQLPPGGYWISCRIEDLNAPKLSVVGLVKNQFHQSIVSRARINLPEIPANEPSFSSTLFVWDINPKESGLLKYRPNPSRMYGLYRDSLNVYVELYLPASIANSPTFDFRTEIVTPNGDLCANRSARCPTRKARKATASTTYPVVLREDLTTFRAGTYTALPQLCARWLDARARARRRFLGGVGPAHVGNAAPRVPGGSSISHGRSRVQDVRREDPRRAGTDPRQNVEEPRSRHHHREQ